MTGLGISSDSTQSVSNEVQERGQGKRQTIVLGPDFHLAIGSEHMSGAHGKRFGRIHFWDNKHSFSLHRE